MRLRMLAFLLLMLLVCVACNSKPVIPSTIPLSPKASPTIISSVSATLASSPTPTRLPTNTPTPLPTDTTTPAGIAPPSGLIYRTQTGLWRTKINDQPTKLIDQGYAVAISPDGNHALAIDNDSARQDLWLIDFRTGQHHNLTENLDRVVCCPVWWPSHPDWVLFGSWPRDYHEQPADGSLSAARLDGTKYRILDTESQSFALPAPNDHTIAYDRAGNAWLYDWNVGPKQFDPAEYGVSNILRIASPAWSPDGKQLAWYIGGDFGQGWQVGLAVFNLETKTGRLLHVYTTVGRGGWFAAPVWNPDGQWLAFSAEDQEQARAGLWVVRLDGQEEHLITSEGKRSYAPPVWSPNGRWLAAGRTLYEVGTWQPQPLALPPDAEVVAWIDPASQ